MTQDLAISLLKKGANGDEILQILNTISSADLDENDNNSPTLDEIDF